MEAFLRRTRVVYIPTKPGQTGNRIVDVLWPFGYLMFFCSPLRNPQDSH